MSEATMDTGTMDLAFHDSRFTAEISKRMQVPERIHIGGQEKGGGDGQNVATDITRGTMKTQEEVAPLNMQVPERILVAGGNSHVAAKNLPRELQLESSVLSPSPEQIRVFTPPRSIRLEDHSFPTVDQDDQRSSRNSNRSDIPGITSISENVEPTSPLRTPQKTAPPINPVSELPGRGHYVHNLGGRMSRETSDLGVHSLAAYKSERGIEGSVKESMTPFEELQLVRRQIAKLNHRLMAVELENQQQQQREMIFSILVTAYFVGKFIMWVNKPH